MKPKFVAYALTTALCLTAGIAAAESKIEAPPLWDKHCASCHGKTGKGDTRMGKRTGAKDYSDPKVQEAVTDEQAFKSVKEGMKEEDDKVIMKPYAEVLSDEEIKALVAYMRTFAKK
jgi:cytochrome c553